MRGATIVAIAAFAIALLGAVLWPLFAMQRRNGPDPTTSHLHMLGIALALYADDNSGRLPPMRTAAEAAGALGSYVRYTEYPSRRIDSVLMDPTTERPFVPNLRLSGKRLTTVPRSTVAFYQAVPDGFGRRKVVLVSGDVKSLTRAELNSSLALR